METKLDAYVLRCESVRVVLLVVCPSRSIPLFSTMFDRALDSNGFQVQLEGGHLEPRGDGDRDDEGAATLLGDAPDEGCKSGLRSLYCTVVRVRASVFCVGSCRGQLPCNPSYFAPPDLGERCLSMTMMLRTLPSP